MISTGGGLATGNGGEGTIMGGGEIGSGTVGGGSTTGGGSTYRAMLYSYIA